jgi:hemerythrin-like domain-containing protein
VLRRCKRLEYTTYCFQVPRHNALKLRARPLRAHVLNHVHTKETRVSGTSERTVINHVHTEETCLFPVLQSAMSQTTFTRKKHVCFRYFRAHCHKPRSHRRNTSVSGTSKRIVTNHVDTEEIRLFPVLQSALSQTTFTHKKHVCLRSFRAQCHKPRSHRRNTSVYGTSERNVTNHVHTEETRLFTVFQSAMSQTFIKSLFCLLKCRPTASHPHNIVFHLCIFQVVWCAVGLLFDLHINWTRGRRQSFDWMWTLT